MGGLEGPPKPPALGSAPARPERSSILLRVFGASKGPPSPPSNVVFLRTTTRAAFRRRRTRGVVGGASGGRGALRPGDGTFLRVIRRLLLSAFKTQARCQRGARDSDSGA